MYPIVFSVVLSQGIACKETFIRLDEAPLESDIEVNGGYLTWLVLVVIDLLWCFFLVLCCPRKCCVFIFNGFLSTLFLLQVIIFMLNIIVRNGIRAMVGI